MYLRFRSPPSSPLLSATMLKHPFLRSRFDVAKLRIFTLFTNENTYRAEMLSKRFRLRAMRKHVFGPFFRCGNPSACHQPVGWKVFCSFSYHYFKEMQQGFIGRQFVYLNHGVIWSDHPVKMSDMFRHVKNVVNMSLVWLRVSAAGLSSYIIFDQ